MPRTARARALGSGAGAGTDLGHEGVVGVVGDEEGGLLGGGDLRGPGWGRSLTGEQALVGAVAQLPEDAPMTTEATSRMTKRMVW